MLPDVILNHQENGDLEVSRPFEKMVCDFCNDAPPAWTYPARDITVPALHYSSIGAWASCDACKPFVDAANWVQLAARIVPEFCRRLQRPELMANLMALEIATWYAFEHARSGDPYPHSEVSDFE
jgi:hypothetical protein